MRMREKGASDTRPYTLLDVLVLGDPRVKRTDMRLEFGYPNSGHPLYGEDNLPDPWGNPHDPAGPEGVQPRRRHRQRLLEGQQDVERGRRVANHPFDDHRRPHHADPDPVQRHPSRHHRQGGLAAPRRVARPGRSRIPALSLADIPLGEHRSEPLSFNAPTTDQPLYLELTVSKPGQGVLYHDASTVYTQQ